MGPALEARDMGELTITITAEAEVIPAADPEAAEEAKE